MRPVPVPLLDSVLLATGIDQRASERFGVGLPYTLGDGQQGQTRDLSATGVSFESETPYVIGAMVQITLRYGLDGHNFPLPCDVEVMRVEASDGRYVIAAKFQRPFLDPDA
jgi:PilZ domain